MLIPKEEVEEEDFSQYYAKKTWLDNDFLFMIDANYFQAFQNEDKFKYNERLTEISDKIEKCYMRLPQAMKEKAKDIMSLIEQDKKNYKEKLDCYFNNGQYYTNILDKFEEDYNGSHEKKTKKLLIDLAESIQQMMGDSVVNVLKFQQLIKKRISQYEQFLNQITQLFNISK